MPISLITFCFIACMGLFQPKHQSGTSAMTTIINNCVREVHGYLSFFRKVFSNLSWINPRVLSLTSFINTLSTMSAITTLLQLFILNPVIFHRTADTMNLRKNMGNLLCLQLLCFESLQLLQYKLGLFSKVVFFY